MTSIKNNFKSNLNKATMIQQDRCGFIVNETHEEKAIPPNNEAITHLERNTPILFSTNRGLHLRMASVTTALTPTTTSLMSTNNAAVPIVNSTYSILFCDLERWSTNRANTISLEDTFTISKPAVSSSSLASSNLRFLPQKSTSVRYNGYARFDIE